ncbi:MAG: YfiR family protein [Bacteroidales bacterium]|nr:YfiR family protein [Bacteroidales bacterium]
MKKRIITTCLLLIAFAFSTEAQVEKLQAFFIYNFTKYIEWPQEYQSGNFQIIVFGNSPIDNYLKDIASSKKVGNQTIEIKKIGAAGEISKCNIIFISSEKSGELQNVISKIGSNSTLIVTEKEGLANSGAAINFVIIGDKQKFELNKRNLTRYGLKINNQLDALAIIVN